MITVVKIDFQNKIKKSSILEWKQTTFTSTDIAIIGKKYLKNKIKREIPFRSSCVVLFFILYILFFYSIDI